MNRYSEHYSVGRNLRRALPARSGERLMEGRMDPSFSELCAYAVPVEIGS